MDATHFHLVFTHFPIVGTIIGIGILAYGLYSKNEAINKVALIIFTLMAILSVPVFLTGEEAEETVEHLAGVSETLMEEHEELAEKAIWVMGFLGVLSLLSFIATIGKMSFARTVTLVTFVVSLGTFGLFAKVGNLGGQIRHSEIRAANGAVNETSSEPSGSYDSKDEEEDDDDD